MEHALTFDIGALIFLPGTLATDWSGIFAVPALNSWTIKHCGNDLML